MSLQTAGYRFILLTIMLLASHAPAFCQMSMQLLDATNKEPVIYALVTNKTTKADTHTDEHGYFTINAKQGDTLLCSRPGYNFSIQYLTPGKTTLYMYPIVHKLQEVEVKSDMLKYKEDSAFRQSVYHKTINDAKFKPKAGFKNGIAVDGLFTALAYKVSGKGKKNKKFAHELVEDDKQRYINLRYSNSVVEAITPLRSDSSQLFIDHFPMTYEFARSATDLEIKVWIRENYKSWTSH